MRLVDTLPIGTTRGEVLRLAGAAESASEHPLAQAIAAAVGDKAAVSEFRNHAGLGIEALVDGHAVIVGRLSFLTHSGISQTDEASSWARQAEAQGQTVV